MVGVMEIGVAMFPTHDAIGPAQLARLAEEHGYDSLFFPEHSHIPASRLSPYGGGGELPRKYLHTYDLFVALTAAATATTKLRVGSGICLIIQRDPIHTAKAVASIDQLSGGRFEFGIGAGWNREEMENHGTNPRVRMAIMRERVEAMKAIWTQDEASYSGEYVKFERIGPGRSRSSGRTRRCWSAVAVRACSIGCSASAMPGCRTSMCLRFSTGHGSCGRGPIGRST